MGGVTGLRISTPQHKRLWAWDLGLPLTSSVCLSISTQSSQTLPAPTWCAGAHMHAQSGRSSAQRARAWGQAAVGLLRDYSTSSTKPQSLSILQMRKPRLREVDGLPRWARIPSLGMNPRREPSGIKGGAGICSRCPLTGHGWSLGEIIQLTVIREVH